MIKGLTKLFSVDTYVVPPVESISAIYMLVLCILNEIISIFGPLTEITGKPAFIKKKALPNYSQLILMYSFL